MKKLLILLGLLALFGPRPCYADSIGERFDHLIQAHKQGPRLAIGESATVVYAWALPMRGGDQGSSRAGTVTSILYWGVFSADGGLLSGDLSQPSKETGSPLLGGSIHVDTLLGILLPELSDTLHGFIPGTAEKLAYRIQFGVGLTHDFTSERTLPVLYAGPMFLF